MGDTLCPVSMGYFLASPFRYLFDSPRKILGPHVEKGMTVLEAGCAMGFFSLPTAMMVGPNGKVVCVDVQEPMLASLRRRAAMAGLTSRVETRKCEGADLGIEDLRGKVDLATAINMVHEADDPRALFGQICDALRPLGRLLFLERKGHVTQERFTEILGFAVDAGFQSLDCSPPHKYSTALLEKPV